MDWMDYKFEVLDESNKYEKFYAKGKQVLKSIPELRKNFDFPFSFPHYWLHLLGYFFKNFPRFIFSNLVERFNLPDLVKIIKIHIELEILTETRKQATRICMP